MENDAALLAKSRQEAQEKRDKLKARGKTFAPMAITPQPQPVTLKSGDDDLRSSFNLCMFGLECDDPDDDYPHDVTCYRYHDAYRRKEFAETFYTEDGPPI